MKTVSYESLRIHPYCNENRFIDVIPIQYGITILLWDSFCYFALIEDKKTGHKLLVFENRNYFLDWLKENEDVKIIFESGAIVVR